MEASQQRAVDFETQYKGTIAADSLTAAHLVFFALEIGMIPAAVYVRIAETTMLSPYLHYLERERRMAVHNLSEAEERIHAGHVRRQSAAG
ncbi:MAG: hypothetical protein O2782_11845 [bacterium]|nr:hypothetical protein [bacterium]